MATLSIDELRNRSIGDPRNDCKSRGEPSSRLFRCFGIARFILGDRIKNVYLRSDNPFVSVDISPICLSLRDLFSEVWKKYAF